METTAGEVPTRDPESPTGSQEPLFHRAAPTRTSSNSRAAKIAGLTTLACLLVASQVFTAYMVFSQRQEIHNLRSDSEKMTKQFTRSQHASSPMKMSMGSLPLLMDFTVTDEATKAPQTRDKEVVETEEEQLKNLLQDFPMPAFNGTFLENLRSLRQHMNDSEWESMESWLRYWLIFRMAEQSPAAKRAKTKCELEASGQKKVGFYRPQCDQQGRYIPRQCWYATGFCWCVDQEGTTIEETLTRGPLDCPKAGARRGMSAPMLMQKTISMDDH